MLSQLISWQVVNFVGVLVGVLVGAFVVTATEVIWELATEMPSFLSPAASIVTKESLRVSVTTAFASSIVSAWTVTVSSMAVAVSSSLRLS
jgi:hypothetical protein